MIESLLAKRRSSKQNRVPMRLLPKFLLLLTLIFAAPLAWSCEPEEILACVQACHSQFDDRITAAQNKVDDDNAIIALIIQQEADVDRRAQLAIQLLEITDASIRATLLAAIVACGERGGTPVAIGICTTAALTAATAAELTATNVFEATMTDLEKQLNQLKIQELQAKQQLITDLTTLRDLQQALLACLAKCHPCPHE